MKRTFLVCLCCLAVVLTTVGQSAKTKGEEGILGIVDPQTGTFRAIPSVDDAEIAEATVVGGTVTVAITITVKTTALATFSCNVQVSAIDGAAIFTETEIVQATGAGGTRMCKVSIPYSWSLATPSTAKMTTSYSVIGSGGATSFTERSSSHTPLDIRLVPANGAITSLSAAVTQ